MAGTTKTITREWGLVAGATSTYPALAALYEEFNKVITDLETLRAGIRNAFVYQHEQLAAGVDISARPIFKAPVALTILDSVLYLPVGDSAGIDGSNTLIVTLRNITEGVDVATITRTTNLTGGTSIAVTLTAANADIAVNNVLGLTLTQGATADVDIGALQFEWRPQTVDAAADMTAAALSTRESGD